MGGQPIICWHRVDIVFLVLVFIHFVRRNNFSLYIFVKF